MLRCLAAMCEPEGNLRLALCSLGGLTGKEQH